jgi:hypothetical protein
MEFRFARISESGVVPSIGMAEEMTALETTLRQAEEPSSREFPASGNTFGRVLRHSCWALLCLSAFILASAPLARGVDDNENSTPTAWWIYTGQTFNDVSNTIKNLNARVVDIKVDNSSPNPFTVTYVCQAVVVVRRNRCRDGSCESLNEQCPADLVEGLRYWRGEYPFCGGDDFQQGRRCQSLVVLFRKIAGGHRQPDESQ